MNVRKTKFLLTLAFTRKWIVIFSIFLGLTSSLFNGISTALIVPIILEVMGENIASKLPPVLQVLLNPFNGLPDRYRVLAMSMFIILAIALKSGSTYLNSITAGKIVRDIATKLREDAMKVFFSVDLSFVNSIKRGDLINRMTAEVDRAIQPIQIWISIIVSSLNIFLFTSFLILLSWKLTLLLVLLIPLPQLLTRSLVSQSRKYGLHLTGLNQDMASHFYEIVDGVKLVRSSCMEDHEYQKSLQYIHAKEKLMLDTEVNRSLFGPISEITNILVIFLLIWGGKLLLTGGNTESLTTILLPYLVTLYRLLPFINQINSQRSSLASYESVLDLMIDFLDRSNKPFSASGDRTFSGLQEGITFNHVHFKYPNSRETILEDINLYIPKGTTLALVGSSGSGKSTLADLMPRFYDPSSGTIEIDGIPLQDFNLRSLRQSIAIVSQDTFVFNNTVRYNIAYGRDAVTDAEVEEAARRANAYEFIKELPDGFNTHIGNRGIRLSGGQRQRIAIARALIQNPEILILDEATSALDTVSERLVQQAIDELSTSRTTIVIAHRLSTIQNAEQIAVLSAGQVVEVGTHEELLEQGGTYAELYQVQAKRQDSVVLSLKREIATELRLASYDIRTALNSMLGSLILVQENLVDTEEERYLLIQNSFHEGLRLLDQLGVLESWSKSTANPDKSQSF